MTKASPNKNGYVLSNKPEMLGIAVGGNGTLGRKRRMWVGCWYKPWTWFRWVNRYELEQLRFMEVSLVSRPSDPVCHLRKGRTEEDFYSELLGEPYELTAEHREQRQAARYRAMSGLGGEPEHVLYGTIDHEHNVIQDMYLESKTKKGNGDD